MKRTQFISVEVVIRTNHECDEWIEWFERQDNYVEKFEGEDHAWFIYFAPLPSDDANTTIQRLCSEITNLPASVLQHWTNAEEREFFMGYHVGETPNHFIEHLDQETVGLVNQHRASIRIAMYPSPDSEEEPEIEEVL